MTNPRIVERMPGSPFWHQRLEQIARRLIADERHEDAVLVTQALLEARTEAVLVFFAEQSREPVFAEGLLESLPSYNLADARVLKVVARFVGIDFNACCQDELRALKRHVALRHGVVHRVELVSREEAELSLEAVLGISERVRTLALLALGLAQEVEDEQRLRERDSE